MKIAGWLLTALLLTACTSASKQPAPITNISANWDAGKAKEIKRPIAKGEYLVQQGDNLYRIALEHGVAYKELAVWNNLSDVNDIKAGQVLRITGPEENYAENKKLVEPAKPAAKIKTVPLTASSNNVKESADVQASQNDNMKAISSNAAVSSSAELDGDALLNMASPTAGKIVTSFAKNGKGIDIGGKLGQPIVAAANGSVVYVGSGLRGYGKMIILKHNKTYLTAYAHNNTLLVKEGDIVKRGQKIAEMGKTDADSVKLHFEVRRFGKPVDPTKYLTS